jgi:hypothetical protein
VPLWTLFGFDFEIFFLIRSFCNNSVDFAPDIVVILVILEAYERRQPQEAHVGNIWHLRQVSQHGTSRDKALMIKALSLSTLELPISDLLPAIQQ